MPATRSTKQVTTQTARLDLFADELRPGERAVVDDAIRIYRQLLDDAGRDAAASAAGGSPGCSSCCLEGAVDG